MEYAFATQHASAVMAAQDTLHPPGREGLSVRHGGACVGQAHWALRGPTFKCLQSSPHPPTQGPITRTEGASVWHGAPGWVLTNVGLLSLNGRAGAPIRTKRVQRTESSLENRHPGPRKPNKGGALSGITRLCDPREQDVLLTQAQTFHSAVLSTRPPLDHQLRSWWLCPSPLCLQLCPPFPPHKHITG